ncbi:MAG: TolC family protein [Alphaproteobacteria bacterium]|nr:TolC family protein [Alphaproteobacteria bacterium]
MNSHLSWKCWSFLLFVFSILSFPVRAEEAIVLDQIIKIALENNKDLKVAKHNVDVAKARLVQAGQYPNPRLNLLNSDDRLLTNEGEYARSVGISQEFPVAGRIGNQENVAKVDIEIALSEIKNAERKLKGEIASGFYTLLVIDLRLEKINAFLTVTKKLMEVTRKRYGAAEVSELDVNAAQLEYERLLQERSLLDSQRITQISKLNELLGGCLSSHLIVHKNLPETFTVETLDEQINLAFKLRPELRIALLSINRAKADNELAHAQKWEDWTVGVGFERDKQVVTGAPPQKPDNKLALNLSIPLPLLNSNQGRIRETTALHSQALSKVDAIKLTIQTEVEKAYSEVQALKNIIDRFDKNSIALSEKNALLAQNAYNNGQISFLEVVQAQRQQNDLQTLYLNTLDQYLQAFVKLQTAIGFWNEKDELQSCN